MPTPWQTEKEKKKAAWLAPWRLSLLWADREAN
jgi:hypothetical protein